MAMPSSSRATSSSLPIMWLPVSWTVGLMTVFLSIAMFFGQNVPENYMVCNASKQLLHHCSWELLQRVQLMMHYRSHSPMCTIIQKCCCKAHAVHTGLVAPCCLYQSCFAQQQDLTLVLLVIPCTACHTLYCSWHLAGRTFSRAHDAIVLPRRLPILGPQDHHLPRPVLYWSCICLGQPSAAAVDGGHSGEGSGSSPAVTCQSGQTCLQPVVTLLSESMLSGAGNVSSQYVSDSYSEQVLLIREQSSMSPG